MRREALLSSQIEGTQSSLSDLLLFELEEAPGVPLDDVVEVSSYVAELEHGLARLQEGFPLSSRLLREIHSWLLARGRCADRLPGEFRRSQNWIGGTRPGNASFVPPPPGLVDECMAALETFIHGGHAGENALPVLVRVWRQKGQTRAGGVPESSMGDKALTAVDQLAVGPTAPGQAVVEQQVRERLSPQGDDDTLDLGEVTEADLSGLIRQREHHLRRRAMQRFPVLHPSLQGAFQSTPVLIWLLLLQVLQQGGGCQGRISEELGIHVITLYK